MIQLKGESKSTWNLLCKCPHTIRIPLCLDILTYVSCVGEATVANRVPSDLSWLKIRKLNIEKKFKKTYRDVFFHVISYTKYTTLPFVWPQEIKASLILHDSQIPKTRIGFGKKISHTAFPSDISFEQHMKMQTKQHTKQHPQKSSLNSWLSGFVIPACLQPLKTKKVKNNTMLQVQRWCL